MQLSHTSLTRIVGTLLILGSFLLAQAQEQQARPPAEYLADVSYTITTGLADGRMAFIGVDGNIEGVANPTLRASPGQIVTITLINGDNVAHDIFVEGFQAAHSAVVARRGSSTTIVFRADQEGTFQYWCTIPGHRQSGMEGSFVVSAAEADEGEQPPEEAETPLESIVREPTDLPGPIAQRDEPVTHEVVLETIERDAYLADGSTYRYWTFNGKVPGPFIRVRVGDTVDVRLINPEDSLMIHSVDLHSVTGPGGGAVATQTLPGEETGFSFKALKPGLYVYHCATPMVAHHIANGMYGLILVEPEGGLEPVDREFYVMQGELYTVSNFGTQGELEFSVEKLLDEDPEYYVFNGAVEALTEYPLEAQVGETVRIFFGVAGPNKISSFHVIGEIFDKVYHEGTVTSEPLTDVQTTTVPAGGSTIVELSLEVPGQYILVDHALSRASRGLAGMLTVEGELNPEVCDGETEGMMGH